MEPGIKAVARSERRRQINFHTPNSQNFSSNGLYFKPALKLQLQV